MWVWVVYCVREGVGRERVGRECVGRDCVGWYLPMAMCRPHSMVWESVGDHIRS